jgi:uncharacterized protein (DUF3820 family)
MVQPDKQVLIDIVNMKMPFGKYEGRLLCDLPLYYLEWFNKKEWPKGKLGFLMQNVYEIKVNGMEPLLRQIKNVIRR